MTKPHGPDRVMPTDARALGPERAFVVEFRSGGATLPDEFLSGGVEHVVSGTAVHFESADELLDFVRGILRSCAPRRDEVP